MAIAHTLQQYLEAQGVDYGVLRHAESSSASQTAEKSRISGNVIAKSVLVKDGAGYMVAVLPASHHINFQALRDQLHREVELASEAEAGKLFADCDLGSVPPMGSAYGLDVIVDDSLQGLEQVYFESGDHACLLHISGRQFGGIMRSSRYGHFSRHD